VATTLPLDDPQDFADARRGLVASDPEVVITNDEGRTVWDTRRYGFVARDAPESVNPSLWRQAKLNGIHGLFEVVPGVHQVRGYDLANLTIIAGRTGWIVVDPLGARETSAAALGLARRALGDAPIVAVIFTHSHLDHFGGIDGVLPDAARSTTRIIAPKGFIEEATSENDLAGLAMGRRATFMYGMSLARSPRGHVDTGLGKEPSQGRFSIAEPTDLVDHTPQPMEIDGVRFVFQYAPGSEAPAELTFYLPDAKAFCGAEVVSHNLHNLYTLRGTKVRDALRWSGYIDEALALFADAEVVFASHHWPVWDNARVRRYLAQQRDTYRYIHDQTLRLANAGETPQEIAEQLELPASLRTVFSSRDYYGTVRHNAKAVYQNYFGWYDGNPAHLDPLPPVEASRRYVEAMGGADEVLRRAREAFERGDYRWAAMLLDHLVFAEPGNGAAREQLAATYDQLGYHAESGPWRDSYLTGAFELRHGEPDPFDPAAAADLLMHLPLDVFFASLSARLKGPDAEGKDTKVNLTFTDLRESWVLSLENAVLHTRRRDPDPAAAATVKLTRPMLVRLVTAQVGLRELIFSDELSIEGSRLALLSFLLLLERPGKPFPIVTP
jgi:alkyl sulfatase BDS1-like metallo-beta-lactamase superfamily hydrolase